MCSFGGWWSRGSQIPCVSYWLMNHPYTSHSCWSYKFSHTFATFKQKIQPHLTLKIQYLYLSIAFSPDMLYIFLMYMNEYYLLNGLSPRIWISCLPEFQFRLVYWQRYSYQLQWIIFNILIFWIFNIYILFIGKGIQISFNALLVKPHWEGSIQIFPFLHENITFTF